MSNYGNFANFKNKDYLIPIRHGIIMSSINNDFCIVVKVETRFVKNYAVELDNRYSIALILTTTSINAAAIYSITYYILQVYLNDKCTS